MRKSLSKLITVLLVLSVIFSLIQTGTVFAEEKTTITYEFTGEHKDDPGYADGKITFHPGNDCTMWDYYVIYFGNEDGVLPDYRYIGTADVTGDEEVFVIPEHMLIPDGATRILVFDSEEPKDTDTSLENLICEAEIPEYKRLKSENLGEPELVFASLSDLHLNYKWADEKWLRALNYFQSIGIDLITISGDYTNDGCDEQFTKFVNQIKNSDYTGRIWGCIGNHDTGNKENYKAYLADYCTGGTDLYFYKVAENGDIFIFMAEDTLSQTDYSNIDDCFSKKQLDWLENLLETYSGKGHNIFIYEHANFLNWGAGDVIPGVYVQPLHITPDRPHNTRLVALLNEYKEAIFITGHTHVAFSEGVNFVGNDGKTARTVHNSSVSQIRVYDTLKKSLIYNTNEYESEGYIVKVYADKIIYTAMDLTGHITIPSASFILEAFSLDHTDTADIKEISINKEKSMLFYEVGEDSEDISLVLDVTYQDGTVKEVSEGYNVLLMNRASTVLTDQTKITEDTDYILVFYGGCYTTFTPQFITENYLNYLAGHGTKESPYLISSARDFYFFTRATKLMVSEREYGIEVLTRKNYFKQTANIDMSELDDSLDYSGNDANNYADYCFEGVYDGDGYTLNVDIQGKGGNTSVFPSIKGLLMNLRITGKITPAYDSTNVQVIRGVKKGGAVINVICDVEYTGGKVSGIYNTEGSLIDVCIGGKADVTKLTVKGSNYDPENAVSVYHNFRNEDGTELETEDILFEADENKLQKLFDRRNETETVLISSIVDKYGFSAENIIKWTYDWDEPDAPEKASNGYLIWIIIAAAVLAAAAIILVIIKRKKA